jgi:hypothetical protein
VRVLLEAAGPKFRGGSERFVSVKPLTGFTYAQVSSVKLVTALTCAILKAVKALTGFTGAIQRAVKRLTAFTCAIPNAVKRLTDTTRARPPAAGGGRKADFARPGAARTNFLEIFGSNYSNTGRVRRLTAIHSGSFHESHPKSTTDR